MSLVDVVTVALRAVTTNGSSNTAHPPPAINAVALQRHTLSLAMEKTSAFLADPTVAACVEHAKRQRQLIRCSSTRMRDEGGDKEDTAASPGEVIIQRVTQLYVNVLSCVVAESASPSNQLRDHAPNGHHPFAQAIMSKFLSDKAVLSAVTLRDAGLPPGGGRRGREPIDESDHCRRIEDMFFPNNGDTALQPSRIGHVARVLQGLHTTVSEQLLNPGDRYCRCCPRDNTSSDKKQSSRDVRTTLWDAHVDMSLRHALQYHQHLVSSGHCARRQEDIEGMWPVSSYVMSVALHHHNATQNALVCFFPSLEQQSEALDEALNESNDAANVTSSAVKAVEALLCYVSLPWVQSVRQIIRMLAPTRNVWSLLDDDVDVNASKDANEAVFTGGRSDKDAFAVWVENEDRGNASDGVLAHFLVPIDETTMLIHEQQQQSSSSAQLAALLRGWERLRSRTLLPATIYRLWELGRSSLSSHEGGTSSAGARDALLSFLYFTSTAGSASSSLGANEEEEGGHEAGGSSAELLASIHDAAEFIQYSLQRPDVLFLGAPEAPSPQSFASRLAAVALMTDAAQVCLITSLPCWGAGPSAAAPTTTTTGAGGGASTLLQPFTGPGWEGFCFSHRDDDVGQTPLSSVATTTQDVSMPPPPVLAVRGKIKLKVSQDTSISIVAAAPPPPPSIPYYCCASPTWQKGAKALIATLEEECSTLIDSVVGGGVDEWNRIASARPKSIVRLVVTGDTKPPAWLADLALPAWQHEASNSEPRSHVDETAQGTSHATAVLISIAVLRYVTRLSFAITSHVGSRSEGQMALGHQQLGPTSVGVAMLMRLVKHCPGWWVHSRGVNVLERALGDVVSTAPAQVASIAAHLRDEWLLKGLQVMSEDRLASRNVS